MLNNPLFLFRNIHLEKKCFLIATGPSINKNNLSLLKNEITFGCNTLYKHYFKTNYFCVFDNKVWENHKKYITYKYKKIFCPFSHIRFKLIDKVLKNRYEYGNISKGIYKAHTVVGIMLQISFWMGFKEVILLGCDCKYSKKNHHFDGGLVDNFKRENWQDVFDCYEIAKKKYEKNGRKIYNCTVGGELEVFERRKMEDFL